MTGDENRLGHFFADSRSKLERQWLRSIRTRVLRYMRHMTKEEKRKLLVVLDKKHPKKPFGRKAAHQTTGYYRREVIAHMARLGLL